LRVLLSRVVWHTLGISKVLLLMHCSGGNSGATVLSEGRARLHLTRRLEWRGDWAAHMRHGAVRLWRLVSQLWVVVTLRVCAATATASELTTAHVCVAHITVR
jgi:hypothetical protein